MKKILYIDMDNVLVDFDATLSWLDTTTGKPSGDRIKNIPGIFSRMPPVIGAIEAYQNLSVLFDTYILSTAPWKNPSAWSDKLLWVQRYLGERAHQRLILSHHKNLHYGHYLIDDRTNNGAGQFRGVHIHYGTEQYPDWDAVVAFLEKNT